jgi:hypothetical protein
MDDTYSKEWIAAALKACEDERAFNPQQAVELLRDYGASIPEMGAAMKRFRRDYPCLYHEKVRDGI